MGRETLSERPKLKQSKRISLKAYWCCWCCGGCCYCCCSFTIRNTYILWSARRDGYIEQQQTQKKIEEMTSTTAIGDGCHDNIAHHDYDDDYVLCIIRLSSTTFTILCIHVRYVLYAHNMHASLYIHIWTWHRRPHWNFKYSNICQMNTFRIAYICSKKAYYVRHWIWNRRTAELFMSLVKAFADVSTYNTNKWG